MTSFSRRVLEGTGVLTASGVAARFLSFLTAPILTRVLGPEPYGTAALLGTIVALGTTLALLGIDMAYMRFAFQGGEEQRRQAEIYCWRFALTGAAIAGLAGGFFWWLAGGSWVGAHYPFAYFVALATVLSVMSTMASTRSRLRDEYSWMAIVAVISAIISAAVSVCLSLFLRADAWALLLGVLAGSATTVTMLGIPPLAMLETSSGISRAEKIAIFSLGVSGSVTAPVHWLIFSSDRWFIASYADTAAAGIYAMAAQIALLGSMLNNSITMTWFPEISRMNSEQQSSSIGAIWVNCARMIALMALAWVAVSAAGGDIIRLLAAPSFHSASAYVPWLAGGVFFNGVCSVLTSSMFLMNRMIYVAFTWMAGGLVCLALYFVFTNEMGAIGAAIAQCLTFFFMAVVLHLISRRILSVPLPWMQLGAIAVLTAIAVLLMSPPWSAFPITSLAMKAPVGLAFSIVVGMIVDRQIVTRYARRWGPA